jgi:arylsulfatase A-like enzyme
MPPPAARSLIYGLWFVGVISLGEFVYWYYEKVTRSRVPGAYLVWSIPFGYGIILGAAALVWLLAARQWPHRRWLPAGLFVCAFVGVSGWLLIVRKLYPLAVVALAAGVAAQSARLSARYPDFFDRWVRRTVWLPAVVSIGLAVGFFTWPRWVEHRALAALPAASPSSPNVLLIVLDTVRAKSISLYGYARSTTPNLDRLAARGVVFNHAYSTAPWTLPAHGSMFTGRFPHELTGNWLSAIDATHPTLAETLAREGYLTAGFIANTAYCGAEYGLARGFDHYEDHEIAPTAALLSTSFGGSLAKALKIADRPIADRKFGLKTAADVNGEFLRWLGARDATRPYFAFLNYYDAHAAYQAPQEFRRRFRSTDPRGDVWSRKLDAWSPEQIRELNDAYDATIAYVDAELGQLIAALEHRGSLDRTLVIITSDHGEQFGEHDLLEHANSLYAQVLHVPLIAMYPRQLPAGIRTDAFVSIRDLPATILDLTNLENRAALPGRSLRRHWANAGGGIDEPLLQEVERAFDAYPDRYPARKGRMESIIFKGMHYIKNEGSGQEELYDLARDPEETTDLAGSEPGMIRECRLHLQRLLQRVGTR